MDVETCAACGTPASWYDPDTDAVYCIHCALRLADDRWYAKNWDDRLDDMGFEVIEP